RYPHRHRSHPGRSGRTSVWESGPRWRRRRARSAGRCWCPLSWARPTVYLLMPPGGPSQGEVTLVYGPRPGIATASETGVGVLVTEARGSVNEQFFEKTAGPDTTVETVSVDGHDGWWISGKPHMFVFVDSNNEPRFETL